MSNQISVMEDTILKIQGKIDNIELTMEAVEV
jgi:hypothetical protein